MSNYAIKVENLTKSYNIRHQQAERYTALRDVLAHSVKGISNRLLGHANGHADPNSEEFWALNNVSFEIKQGERIGIIGRNGAGKSTLLKILSRITEPTSGKVRIKGRMASLLEVGTGFHPELTGRENIYLNGAILGMHREEIRRKFDEIVAFAEVEKFLDTPVKRYSSGMYVRLAFSVAAHLEPEILVVDEVLAVGDEAFQKKCLGKMGNVAKEGRTVLFVSHNMGAVSRLCQRVICLQDGRLIDDSIATEAITRYISTIEGNGFSEANIADRGGVSRNGKARLLRAYLQDTQNNPSNLFSLGDSIVIEFDVEYYENSSNFTHSVQILSSDGTSLYNIWDIDFLTEKPSSAKRRRIRVQIDDISLYPDDYYVSLWIGDSGANTVDHATNCLHFSIVQNNPQIKWQLTKRVGLIWKPACWKFNDEYS